MMILEEAYVTKLRRRKEVMTLKEAMGCVTNLTEEQK